MNNRSHIDDDTEADASGHSATFIALVELVRHLARCAAKSDYEGILEATKANESLLANWKKKQ